jgi:hypothetical protein
MHVIFCRAKGHKGSDVTMATKDNYLLYGNNDVKALAALGIKDPWISLNHLVDYHEIW